MNSIANVVVAIAAVMIMLAIVTSAVLVIIIILTAVKQSGRVEKRNKPAKRESCSSIEDAWWEAIR